MVGISFRMGEDRSAISRKGAIFKLTLNSLPTGNDGVLFTSGSFLLLSQDIIENVKNMSIRFQCFSSMGIILFV